MRVTCCKYLYISGLYPRGLPLNHPGKAHEGEGHDAGGDEGDGDTLEGFGDIAGLELLADCGEQGNGQAETDGRGNGEHHRLAQVEHVCLAAKGELLLDNHQRHAKHGAVGGYQRQEDTQRLIECRADFLEDDLYHLDQAGDDQDKGHRLHVDHVERNQHIGLQQPCHAGSQSHHKGNGQRHAHGGVDLLTHAQERTDTQELGEDDIIDEYRGYQYQKYCHSLDPPLC